jgi:hypothetical protein
MPPPSPSDASATVAVASPADNQAHLHAEYVAHAEYVESCQDAVIKYFKHMPSSVKKTSKYTELRKDPSFDPKAIHISAVYITQATDEHMFSNIKDELYGVFAEVLQDMLTNAF